MRSPEKSKLCERGFVGNIPLGEEAGYGSATVRERRMPAPCCECSQRVLARIPEEPQATQLDLKQAVFSGFNHKAYFTLPPIGPLNLLMHSLLLDENMGKSQDLLFFLSRKLISL
jgi:hypothetical protein